MEIHVRLLSGVALYGTERYHGSNVLIFVKNKDKIKEEQNQKHVMLFIIYQSELAVNQEQHISETEHNMYLYFIRHGQTDWNKAGKIQGSCDIELNADGRKQAEILYRKLKVENTLITRIYTSKQKRAHQTAAILSKATDLELITMDGLQEVNLGLWEGLSWSEVRDQFPSEYEAWYHNRRYDKSHKGESYQEVVDRVMKAIHTIIKENASDIAIVTHNAVIMCLQCYLTNTPFEEMISFKSSNTAITCIDSDKFLK